MSEVAHIIALRQSVVNSVGSVVLRAVALAVHLRSVIVILKGEAICSFRWLEIAHLHPVRAASAEGVVSVYASGVKTRGGATTKVRQGERCRSPCRGRRLPDGEDATRGRDGLRAPLRFASGT